MFLQYFALQPNYFKTATMYSEISYLEKFEILFLVEAPQFPKLNLKLVSLRTYHPYKNR